MINGWSVVNILSPGKTANSYELGLNCYYCTAAALQHKTCDELVSSSELMQAQTGSVDDFAQLFSCSIEHKEFDALQHVKNFLLTQLKPHQAVAFGYNRIDGTGHMIGVFKATTSIDNRGNVTTEPWGNLRNIDYQTPNPQPADGLLPDGEQEIKMRKYHVLYLS